VWEITGEAPVGPTGDFDGDGLVAFSDFLMFAQGFGGTDPAYDLDGDGRVAFGDFLIEFDILDHEFRASALFQHVFKYHPFREPPFLDFHHIFEVQLFQQLSALCIEFLPQGYLFRLIDP